MAGAPKGECGHGGIKSLGVSAAGIKGEFHFDATGKTVENLGWATKTWEFVATGGETTLEFFTLDKTDRGCGPYLDDVRVVALPGIK
jgi:hypothetical protein